MKKMDEYAGTCYCDFTELVEHQPQLAKELLNHVDEGAWQDSELYVYDSLADFAYYELLDGWYVSLGFNRDGNYNGAPDPIAHIDLTGLGSHLSRTWDATCHYRSDDNLVITTAIGW